MERVIKINLIFHWPIYFQYDQPYKAKVPESERCLSWNSGKPHGQNAHRTENCEQNLPPPPDSPWERPCFNSGTVPTQGLWVVYVIMYVPPCWPAGLGRCRCLTLLYPVEYAEKQKAKNCSQKSLFGDIALRKYFTCSRACRARR